MIIFIFFIIICTFLCQIQGPNQLISCSVCATLPFGTCSSLLISTRHVLMVSVDDCMDLKRNLFRFSALEQVQHHFAHQIPV